MIIDEEEYLNHYGTPRHSGRYPWGSGGNVVGGNETIRKPQRSISFLDSVKELEQRGLSQKEIKDALGLDSIGQLRARKTIARNEKKQYEINTARKLQNKGLSNGEIAIKMGVSGESYVRTLLVEGAKEKTDVITQTANMLKDEVDSKGFIQIGSGVEHSLGMSSERLRAVVDILKEKGYVVHTPKVTQVGTGKETKVKTLGPPGATWGDAQKALNAAEVHLIGAYSDDGGRTLTKIHPPLPINPKRVGVLYKEDGGNEADGVIYVRPGVKDVSIGNSRYAQVRIKVGDNHYLKGMAMYKDDLPKGVDLLFNTSKSDKTGNKLDVMKELEDSSEYPFKTIVRQLITDKGTDKERPYSVMNLVGDKEGSGEEGSWGTWKKNLSSQFLSKQSPTLARAQLDMTQERRQKEFDEIMSLTNPVIKKKLLDKFADKTDSSAAHLDAVQLHRQAWHVILPDNTLKPNEVYAPGFHDGESVVLIRYPHAGTFEIPELIVNTRHRQSKELLGNNPRDAIAIHHSVAQRLSGADFDGDAVLVIPNRSRKVTHTKALEGLKDFDHIESFQGYEGMKVMNDREKGIEMGKISNLITDMTIKLAPHDEIARAVRHSMVVIDAQKHELNWKESERQNGIPALRKEYQNKSSGGASTLLSKATSELHVLDRKDRPQSEGGPIDSKGRRVYVPTNKKGRDGTLKKIRTTKLAEAHDAHTLSSDTPMEKIYANHSNKLKDLANKARLESVKTPRLKLSKSAKRIYAPQVESLKSKLIIAEKNSPLERQAQIVANQQTRMKRQADPTLSKDTIKKISFKELETARARLNSGKKNRMIDITPKEWDAIQAGAVSHSVLERILNNTELDRVKKLATPKKQVLMTPAKTLRAKQMLESGYTRAQIASQLGVSLSTLDRSTIEEGE